MYRHLATILGIKSRIRILAKFINSKLDGNIYITLETSKQLLFWGL